MYKFGITPLFCKVGYRYGRDTAGLETIDYLEFIARVTSHIPDKG